MFRVYLNWDARAIVPNTDNVVFLIDVNLDKVHLSVSLVIIRCIDKNFIEYLIQTWHKSDLFML